MKLWIDLDSPLLQVLWHLVPIRFLAIAVQKIAVWLFCNWPRLPHSSAADTSQTNAAQCWGIPAVTTQSDRKAQWLVCCFEVFWPARSYFVRLSAVRAFPRVVSILRAIKAADKLKPDTGIPFMPNNLQSRVQLYLMKMSVLSGN